ncbi:MAG TPA: hypothetical protein VFO25_04325 [Candidatus Eremiobacteraceae bacterium]|nr:hypothetical protein [Candidatus Eremiobacteraceae bacterium]
MWEALTAIGTIGSAIVITVTVLLSARQVRATVDQLEQVRKATQFDAARTVLLDMVDPAFVTAYRFVYLDLEKHMADDSFRRELANVGTADEKVHKELVVMRTLDRIGAYVKYGLVDGDIIYSTYYGRIVVCFERLREVMAVHRDIAGRSMYANLEFLYDDCGRWLAANGIAIDLPAVMERVAAYQARYPAPPIPSGAD